MDDALRAVRAAGYPARREAERRLFEAARAWMAALTYDGLTNTEASLLKSVLDLDAATPKKATTDG